LDILDYKIDLEKTILKIKKNKYKKILLQMPEGLKNKSIEITDLIEKKTDAVVFISADPCYGACDIANCHYKSLGLDFIIQIGHTSIPNLKKEKIPIDFINAESKIDIEKVINKSIKFLDGEKIGIISTGQHIHYFDKIKKILKDNNFKAIIGEGNKRIKLKGQILGCNFSSAKAISDKVDMFLYIGSGNFHPLGLMLSTNKPVIAADPYSNLIKTKELDDLKDNILRQRYGAIARSKEANVFGIIVSIKEGQKRLKKAKKLKNLIKTKQKRSFIFSMDYVTADNLNYYRDIDCFVSTACPRIAIDDYIQYKIPIITPVELEILLGFKKWEDYQFDEIFYND